MAIPPFADADGHRYRGKGWYFPNVACGGTRDCDILISAERWINGVELVIDTPNIGDHGYFQVVDKDNILGYGAGAVLDSFGETWYFSPDKKHHGPYVTQYSAKLLAGLYVRFKYVSTGAQNLNIAVNLYLHMKT